MPTSERDTARRPDPAPTRLAGLDEILHGGLPTGRTTLVAGPAGSGKTVLAMECVARAAEAREPGVFVSFEQEPDEVLSDFDAFDLDIAALTDRGLLEIRHFEVEDGGVPETGEYGLDGLLARLALAIDRVGARRIAVDGLEALVGPLEDSAHLRRELRRLFEWLKGRGLTTVVTGERGEGPGVTRRGLEEYVTDCVIQLDHRVEEGLSTRRARVLKYRGSPHSDDEHPFLIDSAGLAFLPIISANLEHEARDEVISTGIPNVDEMLGRGGYFVGSSVFVSGTAGTGKTSVACSFVEAACRRGERALYLAFEESESQIVRNMRSIGIDLARWIDEGLLHVRARRPSEHGLEQHLAQIRRLLDGSDPRVVVLDPITNLVNVGTRSTTRSMLTRIVDILKSRRVTALFTALESRRDVVEDSGIGVSSLMDAWISLTGASRDGQRPPAIRIVKVRGMAHSRAPRELLMGESGLAVGDPVGAGDPGGAGS